MLEVGANAELLHRFAQQLQTLGETVVRPLIVAGEARVFPSGTRVLEHGRLTVAWGAPLAMEGDATGFVGNGTRIVRKLKENSPASAHWCRTW